MTGWVIQDPGSHPRFRMDWCNSERSTSRLNTLAPHNETWINFNRVVWPRNWFRLNRLMFRDRWPSTCYSPAPFETFHLFLLLLFIHKQKRNGLFRRLLESFSFYWSFDSFSENKENQTKTTIFSLLSLFSEQRFGKVATKEVDFQINDFKVHLKLTLAAAGTKAKQSWNKREKEGGEEGGGGRGREILPIIFSYWWHRFLLIRSISLWFSALGMWIEARKSISWR